MQISVELRYAGVAIGKAEAVRADDGGPGRLFLFSAEPMPVGTVLEMASGTDVATARVVRVVEVAADSKTGMHVELIDASAARAAAVAAAAVAAAEAATGPATTDGVVAAPMPAAGSVAEALASAAEAIGDQAADTGGRVTAPMDAVPSEPMDDGSSVPGRVTAEFSVTEEGGDPGAHPGEPTNGAGKRKRKRKR